MEDIIVGVVAMSISLQLTDVNPCSKWSLRPKTFTVNKSQSKEPRLSLIALSPVLPKTRKGDTTITDKYPIRIVHGSMNGGEL